MVFDLSGRMNLEEVGEVDKLIKLEAGDACLVLDLNEVTLVDRGVVEFLVNCEAKGIALEHCPSFIREWMLRERTKESDDP